MISQAPIPRPRRPGHRPAFTSWGWRLSVTGTEGGPHGDKSPLPAPLGDAGGRMKRPELAASQTGCPGLCGELGWTLCTGRGCGSRLAQQPCHPRPGASHGPCPSARLSPVGTRGCLHLPWEAGTGRGTAPVQAGATFQHLLNACTRSCQCLAQEGARTCGGSRQMLAQCQALYFCFLIKLLLLKV